jgi:hypothetical protein
LLAILLVIRHRMAMSLVQHQHIIKLLRFSRPAWHSKHSVKVCTITSDCLKGYSVIEERLSKSQKALMRQQELKAVGNQADQEDTLAIETRTEAS